MNLFQTLATGTSTEVKEWLLEAGLIIELDGLGAKIIGKAPFLVVTWKRFGKRGMTFWCFFFPEPKNWSFKWNIYGSKSAAFVQYTHGILCAFAMYKYTSKIHIISIYTMIV